MNALDAKMLLRARDNRERRIAELVVIDPIALGSASTNVILVFGHFDPPLERRRPIRRLEAV